MNSFFNHHISAQRESSIIDPKGIVRNISISAADVGRSVDETIRIIDALAFKDEFGEGCPVDWRKGDKGLDYTVETKVDGPIDCTWARSLGVSGRGPDCREPGVPLHSGHLTHPPSH